MSAQSYLSKQMRYGNRPEGIWIKIKISEVWLAPSSFSNELHSSLASDKSCGSYKSTHANTAKAHVPILPFSFTGCCCAKKYGFFGVILSERSLLHRRLWHYLSATLTLTKINRFSKAAVCHYSFNCAHVDKNKSINSREKKLQVVSLCLMIT